MTKLPINFLLYLTSIGLAGGSCWLFYTAITGAKKGMSLAAIKADYRKLIERGQSREADDLRDRYNHDPAWWASFKSANLTGKLPPEPEDVKKPQQQPKGTSSEVPLDQILRVVSISYDDAAGSRDTGVVIQYKPEANVQPPANAFGAVPTAYAGPGDATPGGNGARAGTPVPMAAGPNPSDLLLQYLKINDKLWGPYSDIHLSKVADDASAVFFERDGATEPEKVFKNELNLPTDLLEGFAGAKKGEAATPRKGPVQDTWAAPKETREVTRGQWHVSRKDYDYLRNNMQRVLNEEVGIQPFRYRSRSGRSIRGLQLRHVPSRLARLGLAGGDVVLSVNGVPVDTKARAIKVGRSLYRKGVRTFQVELLSRGQVVMRTFHVPPK